LSSVAVERLEVRDLRNLEVVDLVPARGTNVLCGNNGQGKTSLLEAIYLVATTRSFRTHRLREVVSHGKKATSVRAKFSDALGTRDQFVAVASKESVVRLDGQRPESVASYATRSPVVVFHPGELALTTGPAAGRRTLVDRVALFENPASHASHQAYTRAMRARQRLLQIDPGQHAALSSYERLMARHGAALTSCRRHAADRLIEEAVEVFSSIAPNGFKLSARYQPGGADEELEALQAIEQARERDARRAGASSGPHRDDLVFELNGKPVRTDASQGQHRLLTLSLKIAEMSCISASSGTRPLLLLDDVSSELDSQRMEAFLGYLGARQDQVFLTTTRPEMLLVFEQKLGEQRVFEVVAGRVRML
jgi:DNA replication and repair protein RecF